MKIKEIVFYLDSAWNRNPIISDRVKFLPEFPQPKTANHRASQAILWDYLAKPSSLGCIKLLIFLEVSA